MAKNDNEKHFVDIDTETYLEMLYNGKDDELYRDENDKTKEELELEEIKKKSSTEKTQDEKIKTSRTLKIKHNKWNQVDYGNNFSDKIIVDPDFTTGHEDTTDVELEEKILDIIKNSKYYGIFFDKNERYSINFQTINEIIIFVYGKLNGEYTMSAVFMMMCDWCNINPKTMFTKLSSYMQMRILEELKEISSLPKEYLQQEDNKLF